MITSIISYDGTTFSPDYEVGFVPGSEPRLPSVSAEFLKRVGAWPVVVSLQRKGNRHALIIRIVGSDRDALRAALFRLFDPEDETPKVLVGANQDGVQMYVMAICEELRVIGDQQHDVGFVATLAVDDDVRWRAVTDSTDTWTITASGQTRTISNTGEDDAHPVFQITPTSGKAGGYAYKHYCIVTWRAAKAGARYPIQLGPFDTATPVGAGEMQADGDDLRVFVDGVEVSRSLVSINDANTYIWFQTSFQRSPRLTLASSLAGAGSIDSIELDDVNDEIRLLPSHGFVRVDDEVFGYTSVDLIDMRLNGITREAWDTAAAVHSAGEDVYWMQHEVVLAYGNATASAPTAVPGDVPVITLADSTNDEWKFDVFGDAAYPDRPASWIRWGNVTTGGLSGCYTATERAISTTTFSVIGGWIRNLYTLPDNTPTGGVTGWALASPCGIVNAAWANGKKRAAVVTDFEAFARYFVRSASWWTTQAAIADPSSPNTWEAWSEAAAASDWDPADYLCLALYTYSSDVEAGTVTVSLNVNETPVTSIGDQLGNYTLDATISNGATGEAIRVRLEMALSQDLEVDTPEHTVTYQLDGSNQFQAVSLDASRRHWLRLLPGDNELTYTDTGTAGVTIVTTWARRYY